MYFFLSAPVIKIANQIPNMSQKWPKEYHCYAKKKKKKIGNLFSTLYFEKKHQQQKIK